MGKEAFFPGFGRNFFVQNDFGEFNGLFQTFEGRIGLVMFKFWRLSAALFVIGDELETAKNLTAYLLLAVLVIFSIACFFVMLESEVVDSAGMPGEPGGKFWSVTGSYEGTGWNRRYGGCDLGQVLLCSLFAVSTH